MLSRPELILKLIVEQYLSDGAPVSSKFISEQGGLQVSSATVRNTMVQLEQMGLIRSPHTSAGRIPTTQGIRLFIDKMLQLEAVPQRWLNEIQQTLLPQLPPSVLIQRAGQLLANLTGLVSLLSPPKAGGRVIRQAELVRLAMDKLLLVVIDAEGDVLHRVLAQNADIPQQTLSRSLCVLNAALCGQCWPDAIGRLALMARTEGGDTERLLLDVMAQLSLDEMQQNQPLVYGQHHLLQEAEHQPDAALQQVVQLLEQPACLLQILAPVLQDQCTKLILGRESGITELHNVSIIALRYQAEPHRVLALLGPSRMHYAHLIPLVEAVGLQLSKHLNQP
jgi:heat-inducible transcriptional repressor